MDKALITEAMNDSLANMEHGEQFLINHQDAGLVRDFHSKMDRCLTIFTNIVTCLAAASADSNVDPRYHRQPGKGMPSPNGQRSFFSGRVLSEKVVYPWLEDHSFRTAKSGWQTRTLERPRPYTLDYPENISGPKDEFLGILDCCASGRETAATLLSALFFLEAEHLSTRKEIHKALRARNVTLGTIDELCEVLGQHFEIGNNSRLPVIALHATYSALVRESGGRYGGKEILDLEAHSAADCRTDAIGDIEVVDADGSIFEAVEVKHLVPIDDIVIRKAAEKIQKNPPSRYLILGTGKISCTKVGFEMIRTIREETGCEIILNGIIGTTRYMARVVADPNTIIELYTSGLVADSEIPNLVKLQWNKLLGQYGGG